MSFFPLRECVSFPINHAGGGAAPIPPFDNEEFEFRVNFSNPVQASALIHSQITLFFYIQSMLGLGSGWTDTQNVAITPDPANDFVTAGSSNSVTAGMDGVNRIAASTNLIWSLAGNHSWWVGTHPEDGSQICVDCNNASSINGMSIVLSPGGLFTGGAINARPTAVDQIVILDGSASPGWGESNNSATFLHFQRAQNRTSYRLLQSRNDWAVNMWLYEIPHAIDGWTSPIVFGVYGSNLTAPGAVQLTYTACFSTATPMKALGVAGNIDIQLNLPGIQLANGALPAIAAYAAANAYSGKFPLYVIGMGTATAANIGYLGQLTNIWTGNTNLVAAVDGRWYGANSTDRKYLQCGILVIPWNQSVPQFGAGAKTYIGDAEIYGRTS